MKRVLLRLAAAFGVSLAVVTAVVYNLPDGVKPGQDCTQHLTRAPILMTAPDGGQQYRTLKVPLLRCTTDAGTIDALPDPLVLSCLASVKFDGMPLSQSDDCARGRVPPTVTVQYVGDNHDAPDSDCSDEAACNDGGLELAADPCACSSGSACSEKLPDGGWGTARTGVTLGAGQWQGAGCVQRACTVFSTGSYPDPGWPAACPLEARP